MQKRLYLLLFFGINILSACSYDSERALKNGDVLNMNGPVYNFIYFEEFLKSVETNEADSVRIANYTIEGNPTLYNITFDGSVFHFEIDRSKNKERGDSPAKVSMTCSELVPEEGQQLFSYTLEGCQQGSAIESFTILSILKDQEEEHEH